jgi:ABC-type transporter MlaC component
MIVEGLMIAKGLMDAVGGIQAARATNSAARQNFRNAQIDAAFQYTQNRRQFIERDRAARQQGYDAKLAERAAVASARNSGASGGVMGSTIDALIAEEMRTGATNQSRIQDQRDNNMMDTRAKAQGIRSQTASRINQTPVAKFGLTDFARIAVNTGLGIKQHGSTVDSIGQ